MLLLISHCFDPNVGGVETHLTDLARFLEQRGIPTTVLTYQPLITRTSGRISERRGSVHIIRLPWIGFGLFNKLEPYPAIQFFYLFPVLMLASFFYMLFNAGRVDAIHVHGMVCAVIARFLKAIFRSRVVASTHSVYGWLYDFKSGGVLPRFLRWTLSGADQVLCLADASKRELISLGVPEVRVGRYTYWVDQQIFTPLDRKACRSQLGWPEGFTVLFVGRLIAVKGIEALLAVARGLPDVRFVFAGDGPLLDKVAAAAGGDKSNVKCAGRIDNTALPTYYNAADVLCVPSQYEEGFGRIIIEALSCGCPVIGANKCGIPEAMDSTVGILIDPTEASITEAVERLKADPAKLAALREHCRTFAIARFSIANAEAIVQSYGLSK